MSVLSLRFTLFAVCVLPLCSACSAPVWSDQGEASVSSPLAAMLAGEIAQSRGLTQSAWSAYMAAAKETGSGKAAERAYDIALSAGQTKKAEQALNLLRKLDPESPRLAYERAISELLAGKSDPAHARAIRTYVGSAASPELAFLKAAQQTAGMSDPNSRYELLRSAAKTFPADVRSELTLGQAAAAASKFKRAARHAEKAASLSPDNPQVLLGAAEIEYAGSPEAAQKRLRKFLSSHPDNLQVRLALVKTMVDHAKPDQIDRELDRIDRLGKRTPKNLMTLGALCERASLWARAEGYYREYIRRTEAGEDKTQLPDTGYLRLGMTKLLSGDQAEALTWLHKVEKGDKYVPARVKEAEILAAQGRVNESCDVLKAIRARNPKQRNELVGACAELLVQSRRPADAAETMAILIEENPKNTEAMLRASYYYEKADQLEKSAALLRRYIELRPNDPQGYNSLGYMWADRGINLAKSENLLAKALKLSEGKNPAIIDSFGWLKYRMGKLDDAEEHLRQAASLSTDPEILMHLSQVLFARGKAPEAKTILDKILESDPDNADARAMLKANGF